MVTFILWALVLIVGVPMFLIALSFCLARFSVEVNQSLDSPKLHVVPPEELNDVPARALRKKMEKVEAAGFRLLMGYTVPASRSSGMNNYIFVLLAPD